MLEISWLGFYLLLHLLLCSVWLSALYWLSRQTRLPAARMLKLWQLNAVLLLILPLVLLQPWALDKQLLPWFHQGITQLTGAPALMSSGTAFATDDLAVRYVDWPLLSQLIYQLTPGSWFWLLVPLVSLLRFGRLLHSYLAARGLRQQAQPIRVVLPACRLPVYSHPSISGAMLLGLRHPVIVLPEYYLQHFNNEQLALILRHEECHQQQGDLRSYLIQQLVGCLFWWSPGWHYIATELDRWRELRCDVLVSQQLAAPHQYAQTLLDCARLQCPVNAVPPVFAQRWWQAPLLALRVDTVLRSPQDGQRAGPALLLTLGLLLIGSVGLAQHWQLADLPARHARVSLSALAPVAELLRAVAANDSLKVKQLLAAGAPLNIPIPGDGTALMLAVRIQLPEMVAFLLAQGADPDVSSRGDGNALIIAVQRGNQQLVNQLLDAGADVNAAVLADETPLVNASMRGDVAMARLLLSRGALLNLQVRSPVSDGRQWRSALNQAATPAMRDYLTGLGARDAAIACRTPLHSRSIIASNAGGVDGVSGSQHRTDHIAGQSPP
ncbi:hypothetical protein A5320_02710 [Rheinheimera sp. SA_1]|uniref:M56 family metallopeptidase n=1 Tax=Rheinheimera sp. SA_1 TaxID=1827365 RepID=UPI0007FEC7DE|nr:M56 family metallopeptidase [Rheinheimera sp. SA_1]OBP16339.1 hypothetical protein A5320_02710 [Rheinheimera sp. SA_1]